MDRELRENKPVRGERRYGDWRDRDTGRQYPHAEAGMRGWLLQLPVSDSLR